MSTPKLVTKDNLIVCNTCGAQYDVDESVGKDECRICEVRFQFLGLIILHEEETKQLGVVGLNGRHRDRCLTESRNSVLTRRWMLVGSETFRPAGGPVFHDARENEGLGQVQERV